MKKCKLDNCNKKHYGLNYCNKHYQQFKIYKKIPKENYRSPNEVIIKGNTVEIILKNKNLIKVGQTIIDYKDFEKCKEYKWCLTKTGYAYNQRVGLLHRYILTGKEIDHINRNKLDNRKKNLRAVSRGINVINREGIKGIHFDKSIKKWRAYICRDGIKTRLGIFNNREKANKARRIAELVLDGYSPVWLKSYNCES